MSSHAIAIVGYVALSAMLIALIVPAGRSGRHVATASQLFASIRRRRIGRILLVFAWWWVGWHLFVR